MSCKKCNLMQREAAVGSSVHMGPTVLEFSLTVWGGGGGGGVLSHLSCKDRSIYLYLYIVRKIRNRCSDLLKRMQTYKTSV